MMVDSAYRITGFVLSYDALSIREMMKRLVIFLVLGMSFAAAVSAQSISPSPTPEPDLVKISTTLIQLDVTVTDKNGRIVTDLKPDEFEVFQNGRKQPIAGINFVSNPQPKRQVKGKDKAEELVPEPPLEIRPEQVRRTIALVVDDLTLSFESVAHTRRSLKRFVDDQMQDGDLVAIIRTGAGIGALQQFTTSRWQLYAAIDRVKWNPKGVGQFGSFDPIEPTMTETLRRAGEANIDKEDIQAEREFLQSTAEFRESIFTAGTLGALRYIVNGMESLPGRKSVMLFSDGFKIFNRSEGGSFAASRTLDFLRSLTAEANKRSVVFYPLDARGLEYTGFTAADQVYDPNTQGDGDQLSMSERMNERSRELFDTQAGLVYLARKTGGFAYTNQNDLSAGVQDVLEDQSFYLLAYEPDTADLDPTKLHYLDIQVKVKRSGVRVRHRSGFAVGEEEKRIVVDLNYPTKIMRALSSPFALNGISVKLNALFGHSNKGYYIHSFLHIGAKDLHFVKLPNGNFQANFDILAVAYGDNGVPVEKTNSIGSTTVRPDQLERIKRDGFAYSFLFPIKNPGGYQMRVAVLDRGSREVGSSNQFVNVPNMKKEGLALSGIVLENVSKEFWTASLSGGGLLSSSTKIAEVPDPKFSTAFRIFPRGTVLRFGVEILNARQAKGGMSIRTRVFHDRKMVFESPERPISTLIDREIIAHTDAIELESNLLPGDYVLQVILSDPSAKKKRQIATQYVQFEVRE